MIGWKALFGGSTVALALARERWNDHAATVAWDRRARRLTRMLPGSTAASHNPARVAAGQSWRLKILRSSVTRPPHTENRRVRPLRLRGSVAPREWIDERPDELTIAEGPPDELFEERLRVSHAGAAYIGFDWPSRSSLALWRPDAEISIESREGRPALVYHGETEIRSIPWFALDPPPVEPPARPIVLLSLGPWWIPPDSERPAMSFLRAISLI